MLELLIPIIAGLLGGNAAGAVLKDKSLGALGNTIAGIVGGAVGGVVMNFLTGGGDPAVGMSIGSVIGDIVGGGAGGAIVMAVVGMIKNMNKG
jgi:uncharacterized membrane protein YeaQ/YmgE (transglycosylase-associated protein family)